MAEEHDTPRLKRRMLVLRLTGVGAAASGLAGCVVAPPAAVYQPGPVRTGLNDSDPGDPPGAGRGGYRGPVRTGISDGDPGDPPGGGRGGTRGYRRQVSDSDPRDAPGRGRGW